MGTLGSVVSIMVGLILLGIVIVESILFFGGYFICKAKSKKDKDRWGPYDLDEYTMNYERTFFSYIATSVLLGIIGIVVFLISLGCCIEARVNEPIVYEAAIQQGQTIQTSIDNSKDVVNTDLYIKAVDYNTRLNTWQSYSHNKWYKINFSGDYDWDAIPYVEIPQEKEAS